MIDTPRPLDPALFEPDAHVIYRASCCNQQVYRCTPTARVWMVPAEIRPSRPLAYAGEAACPRCGAALSFEPAPQEAHP